MEYTKLDLGDGDILTADHMAHIEEGIASTAESLADLEDSIITCPGIYYFEASGKEGYTESNILKDSLTKQFITKNQLFIKAKTGICILLDNGIPNLYIGYQGDKAYFGRSEYIFEEDLGPAEPQ